MSPSKIAAFHYADFPLLLRPKSRYPLSKFSLLRDAVLRQGLLPSSQVFVAPDPGEHELLLAHSKAYIESVKSGSLSLAAQREIGFLWSDSMWIRGKRIVGAMLANIDSALSYGCAFSLGGGAHHSHREYGKGFCIFNDIAVGALSLSVRFPKMKIAILDCDVHQGEGTAEILRGVFSVCTISIHAERNFPFRKEKSSLDIALDDDAEDHEYLEAVDSALQFLRKSAQPDFLIHVAGADPFFEDSLGRLSVTAHGLEERDRRVFLLAQELNIPISVCFGGGYCLPIEKTIKLNLQTLRVAKEELAHASLESSNPMQPN